MAGVLAQFHFMASFFAPFIIMAGTSATFPSTSLSVHLPLCQPPPLSTSLSVHPPCLSTSLCPPPSMSTSLSVHPPCPSTSLGPPHFMFTSPSFYLPLCPPSLPVHLPLSTSPSVHLPLCPPPSLSTTLSIPYPSVYPSSAHPPSMEQQLLGNMYCVAIYDLHVYNSWDVTNRPARRAFLNRLSNAKTNRIICVELFAHAVGLNTLLFVQFCRDSPALLP